MPRMTLIRIFVISYAANQPIFVGQPLNRTKIWQGERSLRAYSRLRAKSNCVNDGYPSFTDGFIDHS